MSRTKSMLQAFSFVRGNILVLTVSGSLGMFCRSMVFPYTPLYILSLGGQPAEVGLVYAVGPLGGLLMFPIAGYLADHVNRPRLIAFTGYFSSAVLLINVFAQSWEWIAAARMLQGFAVFHFPATSAIVADSLPPENRGRGIATMTALTGSLALFAPYVAGSMLDAYGVDSGMRILYGIMAAAYAVAATINLLFIEEPRQRPAGTVTLSNISSTFKGAYVGIPRMVRGFSPTLKAHSVIIILCFVANGIAGPFWVVFAMSHIGLTSSEWGLILLVEMALRNLATIPAGFLVDRYGRTRFILAALLLALATVPMFVYAVSFTHVLLIRCVVGLTAAFFGPASSALLADSIPSAVRGRVMAAIGRGAVNLGAASGGMGGPGTGFLIMVPLMLALLSGGVLYSWNPTSPWLFLTIVMAIGLLVAALFVRDPEKAER
jgi:DHA1 family multidrug resistance protein-like MFS transporter